MKLLTYPNQILETPSQLVDGQIFGIPEIVKLLPAMIKIMRRHKGIGLAAPQVGLSYRFCIIGKKAATSVKDLVLINPVIIARSAEQVESTEGCLSLPGFEALVSRACWIKVQAKSIAGQDLNFEAADLFARVIQHEVDHLDGRLINEYTV